MKRNGLGWDSYDAYLFDIDGTLLNCADAVHYFGFCDVLSRTAGRPLNLDGVTTHGNVDTGILRDALRIASVPEEAWRPHHEDMCRDLGAYVQRHFDEFDIHVLPGVKAVLEHLLERGASLGVATGNLKQVGTAKLQRCGLLDYFEFDGYSDGFEYRADVIRAALEKAKQIRGSEARVCVIGDTPSDVRAAHDNRLDAIAVASGTYSLDELRVSSPELLVRSMEDLLRLSQHA